jgi:hypothetical protein
MERKDDMDLKQERDNKDDDNDDDSQQAARDHFPRLWILFTWGWDARRNRRRRRTIPIFIDQEVPDDVEQLYNPSYRPSSDVQRQRQMIPVEAEQACVCRNGRDMPREVVPAAEHNETSRGRRRLVSITTIMLWLSCVILLHTVSQIPK